MSSFLFDHTPSLCFWGVSLRCHEARSTPTPCYPQRLRGDLQRYHCATASGERCPPTGACSSRPPSSSHALDPHICVSEPEKSWGCQAGAPRTPCLAQHQRGAGRRTAGGVALDPLFDGRTTKIVLQQYHVCTGIEVWEAAKNFHRRFARECFSEI